MILLEQLGLYLLDSIEDACVHLGRFVDHMVIKTSLYLYDPRIEVNAHDQIRQKGSVKKRIPISPSQIVSTHGSVPLRGSVTANHYSDYCIIILGVFQNVLTCMLPCFEM